MAGTPLVATVIAPTLLTTLDAPQPTDTVLLLASILGTGTTHTYILLQLLELLTLLDSDWT